MPHNWDEIEARAIKREKIEESCRKYRQKLSALSLRTEYVLGSSHNEDNCFPDDWPRSTEEPTRSKERR